MTPGLCLDMRLPDSTHVSYRETGGRSLACSSSFWQKQGLEASLTLPLLT